MGALAVAWSPAAPPGSLVSAKVNPNPASCSKHADVGERCVQVEGAHPVGALAVTWSPAAPPGSLVSAKGPGRPERRFASAGCDNTVKVRLLGFQC